MRDQSGSRRAGWSYAALALIIGVASIPFDNKNTQDLSLIVPYFSGAANFEPGRGWMYAKGDVEIVAALESPGDRDRYRFERSDDVEKYHFQEMGYVFVSLVARNVFFWQGDLKAVESLQVLTHIIVTLWIMALLKRRSSQMLFFCLYGLNPLIHYFCTFPLYYYWQTIPTALILPFLLDRSFRFGRWTLPVVVIHAFVFMIRPTTLFVSILWLVLVSLKEPRRVAISSLAVALVCGVAIASLTGGGPRMSVFGTAYAGVGAYPNPHVHELSDSSAYDIVESRTGLRLHHAMAQNDPNQEAWERLREVLEEEYLAILRESPLLLLRNAALNCFETFSLGYMTRSVTFSYLSAFSGFIFFSILMLRRRYLFVLTIGLASASFAPYAAPVPAYMFGSYILLVAGLIDLARDLPLIEQWSHRRWLRWWPGLESD